jgi:hypothetical protein
MNQEKIFLCWQLLIEKPKNCSLFQFILMHILHRILSEHVISVVVLPWNEASFPRLENVMYYFVGLYLIIHADKNRNPLTFLVFRP